MTTTNEDNQSTKEKHSIKKENSSNNLKMNFTFKLPPKDPNSDNEKQDKKDNSNDNKSEIIEKKKIIFDSDMKQANSPKKIILASKNSNNNIASTKVSGKLGVLANSNSTILMFSPNPLHNKYEKMLAQLGSDLDLKSKHINTI